MKQQHFIFFSVLYVCAVLYLAITTPISPHEAKIFYTSEDLVSKLMHWGDALVGGFIGLRIFFIFSGLITIILFYFLAKTYLKKREDAFLATVIFMFLPGMLTAFTLVNIAILVLPLVLFFVLMYEKKVFWPLPLVMLALFFIHEASIIFFLSLLIYGIVYKDTKLSILSLAFLLAFIYFAKGIEMGGRPSGHFVEIFGLYASVFSPLLFIFFFYAMYRILLRGKKSLLWYISFTALALSLLLSIRQRIYITDFAPYVMISIIVILEVYFKSVRVRLPEFQKHYKRGYYTVMGILALSATLIIFHKVTYEMMSDTSKHFAKRIYKPYHYAQKLKQDEVPCDTTSRGRERYQLRYYGIPHCENH